MNTFSANRLYRFAGAWMLLLCLATTNQLFAEGSNELTPSADDVPVMLETGREGFGLFADYNSDPNGRLIVSIGRADEIMYFGLAPEHNDNGNRFRGDGFSSYFFRVRRITADGNNPVVHGPFRINNSFSNANSQQEAIFGNYDVTREQNGQQVFTFAPGEVGQYIIEFQDAEDDGAPRVNIPYWDITVTRDGIVKPGRLWSRNWAFRTPRTLPLEQPECVWNRPFNGDLYSYTSDGFVSRIDFENAGMQGLSFTVAFNDSGPGTSGDLAEDRKSVAGRNATQNTAQHRIFLSLPDPELFPDGICGEVTSGTTFNCTGDEGYCLDVSVTRPGQVEVILDFDGNGVLDSNSLDVSRVYEFTAGELSACVPWDGLRGDGTPVTFNDTIDILILYAQGVQHYSAYDIEFMKNGFCVETIRPVCNQALTSNILYWDDTNIPQDPGTGAPKDNRNGSACEDGRRTWTTFELNSGGVCDNFEDSLTTGYGDKNTINTYWFANSRVNGVARVPAVSLTILGPSNLCAGDTVTLTAEDQGLAGTPDFLWSGPGVNGATTADIRVSQAGEYCVVATADQGCSSETCTTITILDLNEDQFPSEITTCPGQPILLPVAGDGNFEYLWTPATGIDDPTSNQPTFSPAVTTTYSVLITNETVPGQSCSRTETMVVVVVQDLNLQVTGGGLICAETTMISATTSTEATISLFDTDGNFVANGPNFEVGLSGYDDYLVRAVSPEGCVDSVFFSVSGGPVNISVPDTVINCFTDGIDLGVTNLDPNDTLTYVWTPASIFTPESVNSANPIFVGAAGDYDVSVTVTNQFGCTVTEDVNLVAIDDSQNLSFTAAVDCSGNTVQFTNTGGIDFGLEYDFGDGTSSNEENPVHVYDSPGTYTVTLSLIYAQNCVASVTQTVTTVASVLDAGFTVDLDGCASEMASLQFTSTTSNSTGNNLNYAWTFTGTDPLSSTDENPSVDIATGGTITASLTVTSADNCSSIFDSTFTVAVPRTGLAEEIVICPGDSAALNPGADPALTYIWSPAPDFDPNTPNPVTAIPGTYIVAVTTDTADLNCTTLDTVTVILSDSIGLVVSGPDGPVSSGGDAGAGGNGDGNGTSGDIVLPTITNCGEPTTLTVDLSTTDDVTVTYTRPDGTVIGSGDNISLTPNGRDTVIITATNEFGCTETAIVVIINSQVDAIPNVGSEGISVCATTDTTITVNNLDPQDTLTYLWTANDIINGPLDGESVDITTPASGDVDLMVLVTNQFGCDTMLTVNVSVTPFTPNTYAPTVQACFEEETTIEGGAAVAGYTYTWEPADNLDLTDPANPVGSFTEDTELTVTIADPATGCESEQTVMVTVEPEVSLMVSPVDTALCEPGSVTATGSSVNGNAEIIWYDDAMLTNQVGEGSSYTVDAPMAGETYTVYAEATDTTTGCSQVQPVTVTVSIISAGLPVPDIMACPGDRPGIFGEVGPTGGLTYTYDPAGSVDLSDPDNPVFAGDGSQTITVNITDPLTGCSATAEVAVTVVELDELTGMADPETIVEGQSSTLSVSGCDDCEYVWNEPNGTVEPDNAATVVATPDDFGLLVYEVDVTKEGCTQIVEIELRVEEPICDPEQIFVPNVFTPNGDNMNDMLRVRSRFTDQLTEFEWIIYDRWGQEVYNSTDINESWDGKAKGDTLEPDVYGFWLRVVCPGGQELIQKGNVSILR